MLKHHSYLVWTKKFIKLLPFVQLQLAMVESLLMYLDVPYYAEISLWTTYLAFSMFESTCLSPFDLPKSFSYCHGDYLCRLQVSLYLRTPTYTNMRGMDLKFPLQSIISVMYKFRRCPNTIHIWFGLKNS